MKTLQTYRNFNSDKSIEELKYNTLKNANNLENSKFELQFYKSLLNKPIYKPHTLNLYERLTQFKNEISTIIKDTTNLINDLNLHANHIRNKIECDDVACDNFFIQNHDELELKTFNFKIKIFNFKFRLFQYIESVINT